MSTCCPPVSTTRQLRPVEWSEQLALRSTKPKAIIDYKCMGCVDCSDQLMQYHHFDRKISKFDKIFFHRWCGAVFIGLHFVRG